MTSGDVGLGDEFADEGRGFALGAKARANCKDSDAVGQRCEATGLCVAESDCALGVFIKWDSHELGRDEGYGIQDRFGDGCGDEAGAPREGRRARPWRVRPLCRTHRR